MILDLNRFVKEGKEEWSELETWLEKFDRDPYQQLEFDQLQRFHYLYQKASADLARLADFSAGQDVRVYLESVVARAFARIHKPRKTKWRLNPVSWVFSRFPTAFRRHLAAFWLALFILVTGSVFGAAAIAFDMEAKPALMPFSHLMQDPAKRVEKEESSSKDQMKGKKSRFASYLISNNTRVAFLTLSMGITYGTGTVLILFTNGAYLGATVTDYVLAGKTKFLLGWLLPHGSVELPAIVLAAQAGFVIAGALIGPLRKTPGVRRRSMRFRLRKVYSDVVTLIGGVCVLLLWAGFVESFLSQYHEPVISYTTKIIFGSVQLTALFFLLFAAGRKRKHV